MMKRRVSPSLPIVVAFGVAACTAPGVAGFTTSDEPPPDVSTTAPASTSATSIEPLPTTSEGQSPATTGEIASTSAADGSSGPIEPIEPPTIVAHALDPDPLVVPSAIAAVIATDNADGVRMKVDNGDPVELALADPDTFQGEIATFTAIDNGGHKATFVAWRDALESAPLVVPFTVALPDAGSELYWASDSAIGKGTVVALAVTPNHELIELGTHFPMGQARCYLRRRTLGGGWDGAVDVIEVLPDIHCSATDLAVDADGALYVLADKFEDGQLRWWLGKFDSWDPQFTHVGVGAPGETANALASDPTQIAVCGTTPQLMTVDAAAWIFSPNKPGKVLQFDYVPDGELKNTFSETAHDCLFSGERLVLAGAALGPHGPNNNVNYSSHFLLEFNTIAEHRLWIVADHEPDKESAAQAITVDPQGRFITVGHTCDEGCTDPIAEVRMFLPGDAQIWHRYLAPGIASPQDIAWSPAGGYFVFASATELGPNDTSFFAQAWVPTHGVPFWTYDHYEAPDLQFAAAVAIGPYGQVYVGGAGVGGYPALAIIAP